MGYRLYDGVEELADTKAAWDALESRSPAHPFQRHDFARMWCETIGVTMGARPLVVVLERDGVPVGLFPACIARYGPISLLTWIGGPDRVDYGDILFDAQRAGVSADEFVRECLALLERRSRLSFTFLPNVRTDALAFSGLSARLRECKRSAAPYVPVEGTLESFVASRSKHQRHILRRCLRRIDARGCYGLRWVEDENGELAAAVRRLVAHKTARYDRLGSRSNLFEPGHVAFVDACASCDPTYAVAELACGDTPAAFALVCTYRDRLYLIQTAFDPEFAWCSPGRVLTYLLLEHCYESGIEVFDLCWGDEAWKYEWTDREVPLVSFAGPGPDGWMLSKMMRARRDLAGVVARAGRV